MGQGTSNVARVFLGIGVGFAAALPVLIIEFIIFFVTPGVLKPKTIENESGSYAYDADMSGRTDYQYTEAASNGEYIELINTNEEKPEEAWEGTTDNAYDREESTNSDVSLTEGSGDSNPQEDNTAENNQMTDYTTMTVEETQYEDFEWLRQVIYEKKEVSEIFVNGGKGIKTPESLVGEWKCYITDDPTESYSSGVTRLMNAEIYSEGNEITLILKWGKMIVNDTGEVIDESDMEPAVLIGTWTENGKYVQTYGDYATSELVQFFVADETQYGSATITWQSGEHDTIGFRRP